ncbi:MAG: hypothetical protein IGR93_06330 [Hydrococcus sp. C42_A2020_068]|uniref:hypothetical protein n=1 Tax=Pleurocapsa sp. PCC 7327 TaxID=118163 RepID=UPI00029FCA81|nr:hypothetical protein [Pleurocapsa sp. PCC 7327]AFY78112.1 hypothetical protein Ple7327_2854 [Pleurocapsa sp. PCC 7327]MBF2019720.1 hypothetical protein [Hydrococcus sp. C42_A2020_068]
MATKQQLDGLNYKQAQKRNSEKFNSFSKIEQKQARQQGYKNLGWENIRKSWTILQKFIPPSPVDFVGFAIKKAEDQYEQAKQGGDLLEVLKAGKAVIKSLKLKY